MHLARSSVLAGLLLSAAVAVHGAEGSGGTLDATKQELRQLQSDQKNKDGQTTDTLKMGTPTPGIQLRETDSSAAWLTDKLKTEKKLEQQKKTNDSWLVEGVEKLEKEGAQSKNTTAGKDSAAKEDAVHEIDQSDPQYLLKLFDEQKKTGDTKSAAAKSSAASTPDPFAPFLQGWLASSPSRGQFFDQFVRKPDAGIAGGLPGAPADYRGPATPGGGPVVSHDAVGAEKPNPYLTELNAPILTKEMVADTAPLPSLGASVLVPEAARGGPALIPLQAAPEARERAKAPLPRLEDDKKYFPQLKRF